MAHDGIDDARDSNGVERHYATFVYRGQYKEMTTAEVPILQLTA